MKRVCLTVRKRPLRPPPAGIQYFQISMSTMKITTYSRGGDDMIAQSTEYLGHYPDTIFSISTVPRHVKSRNLRNEEYKDQRKSPNQCYRMPENCLRHSLPTVDLSGRTTDMHACMHASTRGTRRSCAPSPVDVASEYHYMGTLQEEAWQPRGRCLQVAGLFSK